MSCRSSSCYASDGVVVKDVDGDAHVGGGSGGSSCSSLIGGKKSSTSLFLVCKMERVSMADIPKPLRCSGVEGAAGDAA